MVIESLSVQEMIARIERGEPFEAESGSSGFHLKIRRYRPILGTAIHAGHQVDREWSDRMLIGEDERRFEEDPFTDAFVDGFDISIRALHSRYFYDLNRRPDLCVYDEAWGRQVWRRQPTAVEREQMVALHADYYRLLDGLLGRLERQFGGCLLYDVHSYNYSRIPGSPPLFNIGTHFVDRRHDLVVHHLVEALASIELPGVATRAVCDEVFQGKGYQAEFVSSRHPESLCLPVELKKVFMDEQTFALNPVFSRLQQGLSRAFSANAAFFERQRSSKAQENGA